VLEALGRRPGAGLIYVSSGGTVYGDPDKLPVSESAATRPVGSYGRLHLICEQEIERRCRERSLWARVLRCATVYGEGQAPDRGQGAVVTFLHRIETGEPIHVYGEGETERDYVYVGDVADVILDLLDSTVGPRVLNVGSGVGTSLADLLQLVEAEVGKRAKVVRHPKRDFDVRRIVLDITRLKELTGFEPTSLEDGVSRTHRWLVRTASEPV
jgi:UDP-glucose 4-epimerase